MAARPISGTFAGSGHPRLNRDGAERWRKIFACVIQRRHRTRQEAAQHGEERRTEESPGAESSAIEQAGIRSGCYENTALIITHTG
jgi:hypothetical protein